VLTPNSVEARRLAQAAPDAELADCARALTGLGCKYVLVTGTHEPGAQVVNTLYGPGGKLREDRWPRLAGEYHGSGCTLASAIAAFLGREMSVEDAVREAQAYTWKTLEAGFQPGRGQHLPNRFFGST
jgi:hydroxymethylpyrimidine/phosphomethylpyrimidine kinase